MTGAETEAFTNVDLRAHAPEAQKPSVRFAFEFPELLQLFQSIDPAAKRARLRSRVLGSAAICLVLAALLCASSEPVFSGASESMRHALGYFAAVAGLLGTALALLSFTPWSSQHSWLRLRLQTESLRNFHFLYIAARLPEIVAASGNAELEARYREGRAAAFAKLRERIFGHEAHVLAEIVAEPEQVPLDGLMELAPVQAPDNAPVAADVFAAWRRIRLDWQLSYCETKLAQAAPNGRPTPRRLETIFTLIGWSCIGLIVLMHLLHFADGVLGLSPHWLQVGTIWIALVALAARTFESGLAPQKEVERYEQYRVNMRVTAQRFAAAQSFASRLEVVRAFERVSLEEMIAFLRTHARSHFLM